MKTIEFHNQISIEDATCEQYIPKRIEIGVKKNSDDDNFLNDLFEKTNDEKICTKIGNEYSNTYILYKGFLKREGNTFSYETEKIE